MTDQERDDLKAQLDCTCVALDELYFVQAGKTVRIIASRVDERVKALQTEKAAILQKLRR